MAADAEINLIGKENVSAAISRVEGQIAGLGTKLGGALSAGLALFSTQKIVNFGKMLLRATGESDKFKDRFVEMNKSVTELKVQLGAPILSALEGIAPIVDQIAKNFERWKISEAVEKKFREFQQFLVFIGAGGGKEGAAAGKMLGQALEFRDRMKALNPGLSKEQQAEEKKLLDEELRVGTIGTPENLQNTQQIRELEASIKDMQQKMRDLGVNRFKAMVGSLDFTGNTRQFNIPKQEFLGGTFRPAGSTWQDNKWQAPNTAKMSTFNAPDLQNIAKDMFMGIGRMMATQTELPIVLGKAAGKLAAGDTEGFKASIEDFSGLHSRIQSAAASDPEKDAVKKTAENTGLLVGGVKNVADNVQGVIDALKSGIVAVAG